MYPLHWHELLIIIEKNHYGEQQNGGEQREEPKF